MYVVTNREILEGETGLAQFGPKPNAKGPNEVRVARVTRGGGGRIRVEILPDEIPKNDAAKIIRDHKLGIGQIKDLSGLDILADWDCRPVKVSIC